MLSPSDIGGLHGTPEARLRLRELISQVLISQNVAPETPECSSPQVSERGTTILRPARRGKRTIDLLQTKRSPPHPFLDGVPPQAVWSTLMSDIANIAGHLGAPTGRPSRLDRPEAAPAAPRPPNNGNSLCLCCVCARGCVYLVGCHAQRAVLHAALRGPWHASRTVLRSGVPPLGQGRSRLVACD